MEQTCTCPGVIEATKQGVEAMKKADNPAPSFVVNDYIADMLNGYWEYCTCSASLPDNP